MGQGIELQDLFFGTMASAAVVLFGAFYALFFALARLNRSRMFHIAAVASYLVLALAVFVLAQALKLSGFWIVVVAVMLIGYFTLPRVIWHLCVGTHADAATSRTLQ